MATALEPHFPDDRVKDLIVATAEPDSHMANACRALARMMEPMGDCAQAARR